MSRYDKATCIKPAQLAYFRADSLSAPEPSIAFRIFPKIVVSQAFMPL